MVSLSLMLCASGASIGPANATHQLVSASQQQHEHQHQQQHQSGSLLRHRTHYLNIVPSTHFHYNEGRQLGGRSLSDNSASSDGSAIGGHGQQHALEERSAEFAGHQQAPHIYKRSSALLQAGPMSAANSPLVGSSGMAPLNPLSRRMMHSMAAPIIGPAPPTTNNDDPLQQAATTLVDSQSGGGAIGAPTRAGPDEARTAPSGGGAAAADEAELMRQKQHIQYHDQWPSMAGKCHKRTLNFCASVLPFNTTTFPNIIGDTNRFEVKRSLPFFGFLAKSSCNKRLDELLCLLLEPPCGPHSGVAIPPCKKFCRLALEGCNEYIPATLALSSVFDCRQYPDSNDPNVCINLAQGSKCAHDEFKCPDKTCIPREYPL